ncbi:conjugal transfer protein [Blastococcus aggregatus]|uniref:conjugal transfer protein n=1 Tax=Blastococcus aggregatus TaxID=38502 RepID=UPI000BE30C3B|nr:conjugal transfer protein [Blastococcus aggregatus]
MTTPPRRRDPQPIGRGWELAVVAAGGTLIAIALAALTGLGVASALWGGGWVWPHSTDTVVRVLGGLLHGQPGRGLPPDQLRQVAGQVPAYACIAAAELVLLSGALTTTVLAVRYRRPGDARGGMATRREAEQALGLRQLRAGRAVIRPDRYPSRGGRGRLRRLLSTGAAAVRRRAHRSGASPDSGPTAPRPSTSTSRPTVRSEKESYR